MSSGRSSTPHAPRLRSTAIVVALCGALLLASCNSSSSNTGTAPTTTTPPSVNKVGGLVAGPADGPAVDGSKVRFGIDAEPEGLDPTVYAFSQAGHAVASAVFDPLATLDENGQPVPYLAKAFESNAEFTEWTIVLPEGVKFTDGTPVDGDAVATDLNALKKSAIAGTAMAPITSIEVVDATHVKLQLDRPWRSFPVLFTTQAGYVFAPSMLENPELAKKPVGSGPFTFDFHTDGQVWAFKKNPDYRQPGLPHLDAIEFLPIVDSQVRNQKLENGDVELIQTSSGPQIADLRESQFKQVENRYGDKSFLVLNTAKPPFDSLTARQAIAHATDASLWRKQLTDDVGGPANSPYGPGQPGYLAEDSFPDYDPVKAKELTAQYQTETGKQLQFTILAANDNLNAEVVQTFQQGMVAAGMKVEIKQLPQINLLAQVVTGNYELSQFRLFAQPNPDADVHFYRGSTVPDQGISLNFPRYKNADIDKAIDTALASGDESVRNDAYQSVARVLAAEVPYIWLGQNVWMVAARPKVNGIAAAANGSIATVGPKTWIAGLSMTP
jgi:peptide/nickel transport system substrate-binding protein